MCVSAFVCLSVCLHECVSVCVDVLVFMSVRELLACMYGWVTVLGRV